MKECSMARKNGTDPVTNTANRPRMGTEAYRLAAAPPPQRGKLVPKTGNAKGGADPGAGTATHRGGVTQATLGASYRIVAKRAPYVETDGRTQANGRIVPSMIGVNQNFRSSQH